MKLQYNIEKKTIVIAEIIMQGSNCCPRWKRWKKFSQLHYTAAPAVFSFSGMPLG